MVTPGMPLDGASDVAEGSALWFDGRSSRRRRVRAVVQADTLLVVPDTVGTTEDLGDDETVTAAASKSTMQIPVHRLSVSEAWAEAPMAVTLPDGGTLWVDHEHSPGLAAALAHAGSGQKGQRRFGRPVVATMIASWPTVIAALLATIALLIWFDRQGAGVLGNAVLGLVPPGVDKSVGDQVYASIRKDWLEPTKAPAERRDNIRRRFVEVAAQVAPAHEVKLEFHRMRAGPRTRPAERQDEGREEGGMTLPDRRESGRGASHEDGGGFNAFALPNGTVVMLDGMLAGLSDDELLFVLGHELGHVVHRHGMKNVMRSLGLVTVAGVVFGDFSTVAAGGLATVQSLRHSREAEREADVYGRGFAKAAGLPEGTEVTTLRKLLEVQRRGGVGDVPEWVSTHPPTQERIEAAQRAQAEPGGAK